MSQLFFPPGISVIPQGDFDTTPTENGGWEASQSFLVEKSKITRGSTLDRLFTRGVSIAAIDSKCPPPYHFLKLKLFVVTDHAPGVSKIACTFTGYVNESTNGSSGEETTVETYSLRGTLEEMPITEHRKWPTLESASKQRLSWLMNLPETVQFNIVTGQYGKNDLDAGEFTPFPTDLGVWANPVDDELEFATLIAQGKVTFKNPSWTYTVRTEGSKGFTASQLNSLGKIVENPPGEPVAPSSNYTWLLVGPDQTQSGEKRFIKDLQFILIDRNDENTFLYGP